MALLFLTMVFWIVVSCLDSSYETGSHISFVNKCQLSRAFSSKLAHQFYTAVRCKQYWKLRFSSSIPFPFSSQGMGLVNHVFSEDSLKKLYISNLGIGHTRYSTSGVSVLDNCQPFVVETLHGKIAVAHNGELTNAMRLRRKVGICFPKMRKWKRSVNSLIIEKDYIHLVIIGCKDHFKSTVQIHQNV